MTFLNDPSEDESEPETRPVNRGRGRGRKKRSKPKVDLDDDLDLELDESEAVTDADIFEGAENEIIQVSSSQSNKKEKVPTALNHVQILGFSNFNSSMLNSSKCYPTAPNRI